MMNCDFIYSFCAFFVFLGVVLEAQWEREDHAIDLKYDPMIERTYALMRISLANFNLHKEYHFWNSVHDIYYDAWVYANSEENKLKMATESIDYGKIVLSIGDTILGEEEKQK